MRRNITTLAVLLLMICSAVVNAQTAREDISRNIELAGDNYTAYQGPQKKLSAAPKGYEPYYISHYGRHGSRYLIGRGTYDKPLQLLKEAEKDGMLTEKGRALLEKMQVIHADVEGRHEELTLRGAQQHQQIAQRMFDRFPQLFSDNVIVDAKSSKVIRCILSMTNEVMELKARNPQLEVRTDASEHDMYYIIQDDKELNKQRMPRGSAADKAYHEFRAKHFNPQRVLNSIFSDEAYWQEKIKDPFGFTVDHIWKICSSMQGTELRYNLSLYDLFTEEELYGIWLGRNANWYITHGPSPLNGGTQIYSQRNLIKKMLEEADEALNGKEISGKRLSANLRFGHEVVLMPTACFLNLNGYGKQYESLDELEKVQWYDYRIFPMGSNIQIVFYKNNKSSDADILVRFLLNEDEATVPDLKPVKGCFYKWKDVREYWVKKLEKFSN